MFSKMPKPIFKTLCGLFIVTFLAVGCNSGGEKKDDKKDAPPDTAAKVTPPPATTDTGALMKTDTMPVKTTDRSIPAKD